MNLSVIFVESCCSLSLILTFAFHHSQLSASLRLNAGSAPQDLPNPLPARPLASKALHVLAHERLTTDTSTVAASPRRMPRRPAHDAYLMTLKNTEGNVIEDSKTYLSLRSDRIILRSREIPQVLPSRSPTHTEITRTSNRSSPSRFRGIKKENLMNPNPVVDFETVTEAKKYLPSRLQSF